MRKGSEERLLVINGLFNIALTELFGSKFISGESMLFVLAYTMTKGACTVWTY